MEIGISTFGDIQADGVSGRAIHAHLRMQELITEAKLADEIGLNVFALGEHHRPDFMISTPEVILAGAATVTKKILLSSAVTVLSSADPVRVFQNFSTLDQLSSGRAEIMVGRGSFIESFPLFGYELKYYDELFEEKLDLLLKINQQEIVSWNGKHRSSIDRLGVYPRPYQSQLPIWLAVGGTPASVVRAGKLNLPLTIAILGSDPDQFVPLVERYRYSAKQAGHDESKLPLAINCHFYIADTSQQASDEFYPVYEKMMNRIGKERGWGKLTRAHFEYMRSPRGSLMVGDVKEVTEKILYQHKLFNHTRFLAQMIHGDIPQEKLLHSIELLGREVVPAVRMKLKG